MPEWDETGKLIEDAPKASPTDIFKGQLGRMGSFGAAPTQEDIQAGREANVPMLTLGAMTAPAMIANPIAALKGLGLSLAGGAAGGYAGRAVGGGLEAAGAPGGTSGVLGAAGGLAGGLAGPMVGPSALLKLASLGGGRGGMLSSVVSKLFSEAAAGLEGGAATAARATHPINPAAEARAVEKHAAAMESARLRNELLKQRLEGKAPLRSPRTTKAPSAEAPMVPDSAVSVVAEPMSAAEAGTAALESKAVPGDVSTIVLKLQQQMGTSGGRKVVRDLLAQMPEAEATQIRALLMKGQEHPATVLGKLFDPTKSAVGKVARPGEELARLLGQIP